MIKTDVYKLFLKVATKAMTPHEAQDEFEILLERHRVSEALKGLATEANDSSSFRGVQDFFSKLSKSAVILSNSAEVFTTLMNNTSADKLYKDIRKFEKELGEAKDTLLKFEPTKTRRVSIPESKKESIGPGAILEFVIGERIVKGKFRNYKDGRFNIEVTEDNWGITSVGSLISIPEQFLYMIGATPKEDRVDNGNIEVFYNFDSTSEPGAKIIITTEE